MPMQALVEKVLVSGLWKKRAIGVQFNRLGKETKNITSISIG